MIAPTHLNRQPVTPRGLDRIYEMPRETRSLDDWYRRRNLDLPGFNDLDLDRERFRLSARIAYEPDPCHRAWLVARREAVLTEQRRRTGRR